MDTPLAYFITFTTYGAWLHGRDVGSVDKQHNVFGTPFVEKDDDRLQEERTNMREPAYLLDERRRQVALETIIEVARHRKWRVWACHVRSTHVHIVVTSNDKPEKVMSDFKAYCSRRLKERLNESANTKRWTQHGSTRYLWSEEQVAAKIEYTLNEQGAAMERFDGREKPSEPEA